MIKSKSASAVSSLLAQTGTRTRRLSRSWTVVLTLGISACGGADRTNTDLGLDGAACLIAPPMLVKTELPCGRYGDDRIDAMDNNGIGLMSDLGLPPGRYALPTNAEPTQLVVMFHGHQNDSCSWREHLKAAADLGAIAVAMDYSDQEDREVEGFGFIRNWGWAARSGARDSIVAAQYFLQRYPSISEAFNFSVSMGGNVGGYATYWDQAKRADCSPMWDYWVVAEGVHNLSEEYTGATALAPTNATAAQAAQEMEEENGGTLAEVPERYAEITNALHVSDMSYLKGVVLTHGTNDQTVPYDQSRQMAEQLRGVGVPAHLFTVTGSDHVWEGNGEAVVIRTALDELFRLMGGGEVSNGETPLVGP